MTWYGDTRILRADKGKWVTEDDTSFAIEVKLAPSENVLNWHEVDELPPEPENPAMADEYINTEPEE